MEELLLGLSSSVVILCDRSRNPAAAVKKSRPHATPVDKQLAARMSWQRGHSSVPVSVLVFVFASVSVLLCALCCGGWLGCLPPKKPAPFHPLAPPSLPLFMICCENVCRGNRKAKTKHQRKGVAKKLHQTATKGSSSHRYSIAGCVCVGEGGPYCTYVCWWRRKTTADVSSPMRVTQIVQP